MLRIPSPMARLVSLFFAAGAIGLGSARAAVDEGATAGEEYGFPDAQGLLQNVIDALPRVPVEVEARILSKSRDGRIEKKLNAILLLDWSRPSAKARYTINDAFGAPLETLEVSRRDDGTPRARHLAGDPPEEQPLANLYARIQDTDISWIDLTFSYLWWPGGQTVGGEPVKGRFCYVVDLTPPPAEEGEYAGVRLWIDSQIHILLQAAAYDAEGQLVKLLEVKSFKKIRDVWLIQDIDIQSFPVKHRTSLKVESAKIVEDSEPEEQGGHGEE